MSMQGSASFQREQPMGVYVDDPNVRPDEGRNKHYASYEPLSMQDDHGSHEYHGGHGDHGGHGGHDEHGGHGGHGGHHELPADMKIDPDSGIVPRRCTDFKCCGFSLIFMIFTMVGYVTAKARGHIGRLTHGVDYYGRICGSDPGVENMPWLYWCRNDAPSTGQPAPGGLQLDKPTCVPQCPWDGATEMIECLRPAVVKKEELPNDAFGNVRTQAYTMSESIILTAPYPTQPRGGRYCMPVDEALHSYVLENAPEFSFWGHLKTSLGTLGHMYWVLLVTTVVSSILSYLYFRVLRFCPKVVSYVFLYPPAIVCTLCTIMFLGAIPVAVNEDFPYSQWYMNNIPMFAQASLSPRVGSAYCILFGVLFLFATTLLVGTARKFEPFKIFDLMHCSLDTIKHFPCLMLQPCLESMWKFIVMWNTIDGFRWLCSVSWLNKNRIHINGEHYASLSQVWEFSPYWLWCLVMWLIGGIWLMEVCTAFGQMLISYAVTRYYYMKKVGTPPMKPKTVPFHLWTGARMIILYHPGSLLKGAWTIMLKRPIRFMQWALYEMSPQGGHAGCLKSCCENLFCGCCKSASDQIQDEINGSGFPFKEAYTSVYINGNDFRDAIGKAHELIGLWDSVKYRFQDARAQNTKQTMCIMGIVASSSLSSFVAYSIVSGMFPGTWAIYADPASMLYIANPYLVTALAWILSAYQSYGFITIWDHTMDVLLMCFAWNRWYNRETVKDYCPDHLRQIVGWYDMESDRYPYYGKADPWMYASTWLPWMFPDKKDKIEAPQQAMVNAAPKQQTFSQMMQGTFMGGQAVGPQATEEQPLMTSPHA